MTNKQDLRAQRSQSHEGHSASELEQLATTAIDIGFHLHRELGPGLLESVYEAIMADEFAQRGICVQRQILVPIIYRDRVIENALRADLLVENSLLIELKSTERHAPVHAKQVLTYLRLMRLPLGLLMNFGAATFKEGVKRLANNYYRA